MLGDETLTIFTTFLLLTDDIHVHVTLTLNDGGGIQLNDGCTTGCCYRPEGPLSQGMSDTHECHTLSPVHVLCEHEADQKEGWQ